MSSRTYIVTDNCNTDKLKVACNGKSPMHFIVEICLFGHTVSNTFNNINIIMVNFRDI